MPTPSTPNHPHAEIAYRFSPPITNTELNTLFAAAWENHTPSDFAPILSHSLAYLCACHASHLSVDGFSNDQAPTILRRGLTWQSLFCLSL